MDGTGDAPDAFEKLAKFRPKIGYPDSWRDYSALVITRDDLLGNVRRSAAFEVAAICRNWASPSIATSGS